MGTWSALFYEDVRSTDVGLDHTLEDVYDSTREIQIMPEKNNFNIT